MILPKTIDSDILIWSIFVVLIYSFKRSHGYHVCVNEFNLLFLKGSFNMLNCRDKFFVYSFKCRS